MALIIGHRGAGSGSRENSLVSFDRAIELGADMVEVDVRRSRDGVLFCWHDRTLGLWPLSWGHSESVRMRKPWVPTWAEACEHLGGRVRVQVDIKGPGLAAEICSVAHDHGVDLEIIVHDSSWATGAPSGIPVARGYGKGEPTDLDAFPIWAPKHTLWSPAFTERAHAAGHQVYVYTVNAPGRIRELLDGGVDGIITDRVDVAVKVREGV